MCEKNEMNRISNTLNDLKEKFLEFVKHNDTKNASNFYQKHKEPIFFANKSEVYIDTNAKTIIIGPEAIKAAIEQNNWDVVDWMLDNGFECEGVGKTVSIFWIVYVGEMKDDEPNGKGRKTWSDGTVYEGSWKDGKRGGQGKCSFASGLVYEGNWEDDQRNGQGRSTWPDGKVYEGNWKDDQRNGQGRSTWPDDAVYEGCCKDDKRNGHGTYRWPNGAVYVGCWKNGICFK